MANNLINCYLISGYNNYFNRIVKKDDDFSSYQYKTLTDINFNPNDGVRTELVVGGPVASNIDFNADYFVTLDPQNRPTTRWFVMEQERLRNGQYKLTLKRDVLADYYATIVDSPCYIEKATVNLGDPAIYNSEGIEYNQIKKGETLLKDNLGIAWIVGYVDKSLDEDKTITITSDNYFDYTYASIESLLGEKTLHKNINVTMRTKSQVPIGATGHDAIALYKTIVWSSDLTFNYPAGTHLQRTNYTGSLVPAIVYTKDISQDGEDIFYFLSESLKTNSTSIKNALASNEVNNITDYLNYENKKVYNSDTNKYYKIKINKVTTHISTDVSGTSSLGTALKQCANSVATATSGTAQSATSSSQFTIDYDLDTYQINLIEYSPSAKSITLTASRTHLDDAPYDMFAIPYSNNGIALTDGIKFTYTNSETAIKLAQAIATGLGGGSGSSFIYDLQLLPYCPIDGMYIDNDGHINYQSVSTTVNALEDASETRTCLVFWANKSTGTLNIELPINLPQTNIETKVENDTKMYRLNSPNYSGLFEFNHIKNNGVLYFNVDWTYKPYNPYIHINPNFGGLYGEDFNDARGLICGGDFSLPIVDDKWINYQINNKNFQTIFDRQTQNLEYNRKFDVINNVIGAVTGTASGVAQGAMVGGAAGAIVGGVASAAGGVADIAIDAAKFREGMSLRSDLYNYNLGNIKALPSSLTKSSALNENSKIWPFLEEYDCTEVEKQSLRDKIRYNGMTVMRIGKIKDFLSSEERFVQGQMIRLEHFAEDYHLANDIYMEIKKGAFFTLWDTFNPL